MFRVEDKFLCDMNEMYALQKRIEVVMKMDAYQCGAKEYSVISVYFDDVYDSHLQETIDGCGERDKYRIRVYNNCYDVIKLEVKIKRYNRVHKLSQTITREEMKELLAGRPIRKMSNLDDPITLFNIGLVSRKLRPVVVVAYERSAYVYKTGNVRVTFDRNVRATDKVELFGADELFCDRMLECPDVVEVKYDEMLPGFIAQSLELGNMKHTSYSKYRRCREMLMKGYGRDDY